MVDYRRQCIFAGTINPDGAGYFTDTTGNRRYWPVEVRRVDLAGLVAARDQMWAEAMHRFQAGEAWWPRTRAEVAMTKGEQAARQRADAWEEPIGDWLDEQRRKGQTFVTTQQLMREALEIEKGRQQPQQQRRVAAVLASFPEWRKSRRRLDGERGRKVRGYEYDPSRDADAGGVDEDHI